MRYVETGAGRLPVIAVGCMGIARLSKAECAAFVECGHIRRGSVRKFVRGSGQEPERFA